MKGFNSAVVFLENQSHTVHKYDYVLFTSCTSNLLLPLHR